MELITLAKDYWYVTGVVIIAGLFLLTCLVELVVKLRKHYVLYKQHILSSSKKKPPTFSLDIPTKDNIHFFILTSFFWPAMVLILVGASLLEVPSVLRSLIEWNINRKFRNETLQIENQKELTPCARKLLWWKVK